jgi:hypothetical protein
MRLTMKTRCESPLLRRAIAAIVLVSIAGCGDGDVSDQLSKSLESAKESVSKGVEQAKEAGQQIADSAKQATTTAKEAAGIGGKISLTSNPPVTTTGAYLSFVAATGDRNGAVQIQSYAPNQAETFPSVFIRALVTARKLNEVVGQATPCEIFVQSQADGPVWRLTAGDSAQLKVLSVDGKLVKAEISSATLHETATEQAITLGGQIEAVIP